MTEKERYNQEQLDQALAEALASPDIKDAVWIIDTIELYHSAFTEPIYVYNGNQYGVGDLSGTGITSMQLGIEEGASRNAGQMVQFIACPLELVLPEQGEFSRGNFKIKIGGAVQQLMEHIYNASGSNEEVQFIYRKYRSDIPEQPVQVDMSSSILGANIQGITIEAEAKAFGWLDYNFGKIYTKQEFKGLIGA